VRARYFVCIKTKDGHFITFHRDFSDKDFISREEAGRFGWEYFKKYHGDTENLEYVFVCPNGSDDEWTFYQPTEEVVKG